MFKMFVAVCAVAIVSATGQVAGADSPITTCQLECGNTDTTSVTGTQGGFTTDILHTTDGSSVGIRPTDAVAGATYLYDVQPACGANTTGGDLFCGAAGASCQNPADVAFFVFYRELTPTPGPWLRAPGTVCLSPIPTLDPTVVGGAVARYLDTLPLPRPGLHYAPPTGAIVALPLIVYADPAGPLTTRITALGVTVTVTATPYWTWTFGDGASLESATAGLAYDGTDPRTDPSHYLTHTYRQRPATGTAEVTVTTTWHATYRIAGIAQDYAASGTVVRSETALIAIREYEAVLTGAG